MDRHWYIAMERWNSWSLPQNEIDAKLTCLLEKNSKMSVKKLNVQTPTEKMTREVQQTIFMSQLMRTYYYSLDVDP